MSFFNTMKIKDENGENLTPASNEGLILLRRIFQLLKPLGQITGGGSNRLSVDINTAGTVSTVTTVTTVTTVGTVTNQANIANITAFELLKAQSRAGYNTGVRANLSIT